MVRLFASSLRRLTGAVDPSLTWGVDSKRNRTKQSIDEGVLGFNPYNFVSTIAHGSSIDVFALTQTRDEEVMSYLFGRCNRSTRMNRETLLGTTSHHQRYRCSQYHFFHFTVPDNIIISRSNRMKRGEFFTVNAV